MQGPRLRLRLLPNVEQHQVLHPRRKPGSRSPVFSSYNLLKGFESVGFLGLVGSRNLPNLIYLL